MANRVYLVNPVAYHHQYLTDNEIIYIHIPKVAGHGLMSSLGLETPGHIHLVAYELENPTRFYEFFKIGFVRNPWDRLVSAYFFLFNKQLSSLYNQYMLREIGHLGRFDHFVREYAKNETFRKRMDKEVYFKPQYAWMINTLGQLEMNYIGRYENLSEGFAVLKKKLNKPDAQLQVKNRSEHLPFWEYYTEELVELVRFIYKIDIGMFRYEFPYEKLK